MQIRPKKKNKDRLVPRYHGLSILFFPFVIYIALNFSLVGTFYLKEIITYSAYVFPNIEFDIQQKSVSDLYSLNNSNINNEDNIKNLYAEKLIITILIIGVSVYLFNLPMKIYFRKKRRLKHVPQLIEKYTQFFINFTPEIISLFVLIGSSYMHYNIFYLFINAPDSLFLNSVQNNIFAVSIFTTLLVVLLVYFGQKYRVQTKYIDHVFTIDRLKRKPKGFNFPGLQGRFFITSIFITFIPLVIVLFYVFSSLSTVSSIHLLTESQFTFLFSDSIDIVAMFTKEDPQTVITEFLQNKNVYYIDSFGVFQLLLGVVPGLFFSIIYIFLIVNWSNKSILKPIKELLLSMKKVSKGSLDSYTVVRSREETGQLSHGFNQMLDGLKDRDRIKSLFGQYLSAEVSEEILKGNVDLNGSMYTATILFADIRGFTTISESITPHETISFLNEYYNVIIDVIQKYGGIVDKFMGDGILVLFGVPITSKDHADRAVNAALEIHEKLISFNETRENEGKFAVKIGIGIHTGEVIAGNVGNSNKLEYTVIGDTVNVASRIESLTKKFDTELLIGETVYQNLSNNSKSKERFKKIDGVSLKGKRLKVNLMQLT